MLYLLIGLVVGLIVFVLCYICDAWNPAFPSIACMVFATSVSFLIGCPASNPDGWDNWKVEDVNQHELIAQNQLYCTLSGNGETVNVLYEGTDGEIVARSFNAKDVSFKHGDKAVVEITTEIVECGYWDRIWYLFMPGDRISVVITLPNNVDVELESKLLSVKEYLPSDESSETNSKQYCTKCGVEVSIDWTFCSACGVELAK